MIVFVAGVSYILMTRCASKSDADYYLKLLEGTNRYADLPLSYTRCSKPIHSDTTSVNPVSADYVKGVNEALDAFVLLNLEIQLDNDRKTMGELADIVRQRLGVSKKENVK